METMCPHGGIGRHTGLNQTAKQAVNLSAPMETSEVELVKVGEPFQLATPSQASEEEGVET